MSSHQQSRVGLPRSARLLGRKALSALYRWAVAQVKSLLVSSVPIAPPATITVEHIHPRVAFCVSKRAHAAARQSPHSSKSQAPVLRDQPDHRSEDSGMIDVASGLRAVALCSAAVKLPPCA